MVTIEHLHAMFLRSGGACTDTRELSKGGMFFALKGPNFNANDFASRALDGGCAFAVVDDAAVVKDERFLLVPDVLKALQDLGRHHRRGFDAPVIAITGTNGKTTTKELMHAVLSADRPTLATAGNLNNHIGVPLTLLRLTDEHRIAIVEMGANKPGDIAELCGIAEPTHGLITNIGRAHLEGFGSYEGVIRTKTELYAYIRAHQGTLFVNADDPLLMAKSDGMDCCTYGNAKECNVQGGAEKDGPFLTIAYHERTTGRLTSVRTHMVGAYNGSNAMAAVCAGQYFLLPDDTIAAALAGYVPKNNRSQFVDTGRNRVIMDAYNANPSSMKVALENFAAMEGEGEKLAILGDMLELGRESAQEHEAIIDLLVALKLNAWLVGPEFAKTKNGKTFERYLSTGEAINGGHPERIAHRSILVKGSRGIKLEAVLSAL